MTAATPYTYGGRGAKRERFRALLDGRITVEEYVAAVKREVHETFKRGVPS